MDSSSAMTSPAKKVGVPQTAADGCSAPASARELMSGSTTPVMSVARCMTLGRVSTEGASGTFMAAQ